MFQLLEKISPLTRDQADKLARAARRVLQELSKQFAPENLADKETSEAQRELAKERARREAR